MLVSLPLIHSSPLLKTGNISSIPFSWCLSYTCFLLANFQSPQMSSIWTWIFGLLLLAPPILGFNSMYSTHFSEKSLRFRWSWKSSLEARFSLYHLRTKFFCFEKQVCSFLHCWLQRQLWIVICYLCWQTMCWPWGSQYCTHFHIGFWPWALTQIVPGTLNSEHISVSLLLSLSCLLCQMVASFSACSSTVTRRWLQSLTPKILFQGCDEQLRGFSAY